MSTCPKFPHKTAGHAFVVFSKAPPLKVATSWTGERVIKCHKMSFLPSHSLTHLPWTFCSSKIRGLAVATWPSRHGLNSQTSLQLTLSANHKKTKASSAHGCWRLFPGTLQKYSVKDVKAEHLCFYQYGWSSSTLQHNYHPRLAHGICLPHPSKRLSGFSQTPCNSSSKRHENASKSKCIEHN